MAPSRLSSTCPADAGSGVLGSFISKIARHLVKVRFVRAHRLFHFWNRTLKYYCADCCWKSFAGKRSVACVAAGPRTRLNPLYSPYTEGLERLRRRLKKRGGRARASRKVAPFHAMPSRVPRASPIPLKGHGNDCHTGRPALYVVLFLSLYLPFRFNCTPFSLSNMWYF